MGESESNDIFIVLNPVAGHSTAEEIKRLLEENLNKNGTRYDVYETTGEEDVAALTRNACQKGSTLVIAAGGDGTVAGVINGLLHTNVPLGIIPVGTGNGLARSIGIPLDVEKAVKLIDSDHRQVRLDALKVGDSHYILNVSAGISAKAMEETPVESKRRFGILAYGWTILKTLLGFQPRRFLLTIDGHRLLIRASEILVSNGALLKDPFPLGSPELLNDGVMDVYILTARTLKDYLLIAWNVLIHRGQKKTELRHLTGRQRVTIDAYRGSLPTQADGEPLGITPVDVEMVRDAIEIIAPVIENN